MYQRAMPNNLFTGAERFMLKHKYQLIGKDTCDSLVQFFKNQIKDVGVVLLE